MISSLNLFEYAHNMILAVAHWIVITSFVIRDQLSAQYVDILASVLDAAFDSGRYHQRIHPKSDTILSAEKGDSRFRKMLVGVSLSYFP